jgi:hypothetical protein
MGVLLVACVGFLFVVFQTGEVKETEFIASQSASEQWVEVYQPVSFAGYWTDRTQYDGAKVTLLGYLEHEVIDGVHWEYLVDDEDRKVILKNVDRDQKQLFIPYSTTSQTFNVTGTLRRTYTGYDMSVVSIVEAERETIRQLRKVH